MKNVIAPSHLDSNLAPPRWIRVALPTQSVEQRESNLEVPGSSPGEKGQSHFSMQFKSKLVIISFFILLDGVTYT